MKRVFYVFVIFIFISFMVFGYILNYLTQSYMDQGTEAKAKRDLEILATTTQGALANNNYERVEEQVLLWGELEPHIVFFEVILDGDIELVKFTREFQTLNTLHLTKTISLPSGRIITFSIEYNLSEHDRNAAFITVVFLSMSCCIAVVFIFLLWRILQNLAFIPLNREITERKQAERELAETRGYLEKLINYANAPIIVWDPDLRITKFNHAFEHLTGGSSEEVVGEELSILFPEDTCEQSLLEIERTVSGEYWESVEIPILRKDGSIRVALWNSANIYAEDGTTLIATIAQGVDITERKQAERELAETRGYLEKLINYANAPIIVWDPDLRITKFNHAFEYLTGRSSEEVVGEELSILFPEDTCEQSLLEIERTVSGEYWESVEIPILRKDGSIRVALWNSANIYAEDGTTLIATIAQGVDITERKQAEQERERLLNTLASKNEELQSIVYAASHDLKSPLVNIEGFSGELSRTCEEFKAILEEENDPVALKEKLAPLMYGDVPEALGFISAGTTKMQALLKGLLEVSRVGTAEFEIEAIDMNEMMHLIVTGMQFQITSSGADVTVDDLPDCIGDKDHINQVFTNLLNNAVKYLDPDRKGVIHVSGRTEGGDSIYCVEDNGFGIASAHQPKVFELFHRLDPTGDIKGEGLGLTIVQRILDREGGKIWVESEPGKGSSFFVSLPRA